MPETQKEKTIRILTSLRADFVGEFIPAIRRKKKWKKTEKVSAIAHCAEIGDALKYVIRVLKERKRGRPKTKKENNT